MSDGNEEENNFKTILFVKKIIGFIQNENSIEEGVNVNSAISLSKHILIIITISSSAFPLSY